MSRKRKVAINIASTLILQLITIICGLILPRLLLSFFGSEVNGTVSSISQFLSYIVLLESGIGGVVKAALYKPLAEHDNSKLSGILKATENFFRVIATIFIVYMLVIAGLFPLITNTSFSWWYTASLVVIIGVSTVFQYLFGITYQMLLEADQKGFVFNTLQIGTLIANTLLSAILLFYGVGVHLVKLVSAVIFIIRPVILHLYVKKHYQIDKKQEPDNNAIKQRWEGFGQHLAFFIHSNTDIVVLSMLSNMLWVSVYTVHMSVISGVKNLVNSLANGFAPAIGEMIAKGEADSLRKTVDLYEFVSFFFVSIIFTITGVMIEPFVAIYTKGVTDVNYIQPLFALMMCLAEGIYVIRNVYSSVVFAAGHFKQTNRGAYIEAVINIVVSIALVYKLGLIGVAIGTCCAMVYRTADYVRYLSKNIIFRSPLIFVKRLLVNTFAIIVACAICRLFVANISVNWWSWVLYATIVSITVTIVVAAINALFYKTEFVLFVKKLSR